MQAHPKGEQQKSAETCPHYLLEALGSGVAREAPAQDEPRSAKLLRPREPEKRKKNTKTEPSQQGFQDRPQTQSENTRPQIQSENARPQAQKENARLQAQNENAKLQAQSENARLQDQNENVGGHTGQFSKFYLHVLLYAPQNQNSANKKNIESLFVQNWGA